MELKGSKTEENLMKAFAGESQARNKLVSHKQEINILTMHQKLKKKDMSKLLLFLQKLQKMKKNMLKCGLNY